MTEGGEVQGLLDNRDHHHERKKNFPPCLPVIMHNDINHEIPSHCRATTRFHLWQWYGVCLTVIVNAIAKCSILSYQKTIGTFLDIILACAYVLLLPLYAAWVYSKLYNGVKLQRASTLMTFFCLFAVQLIAEFLFALGISRTGGAGIVEMANCFENNEKIAGLIHLASFGLWACLLAAGVFLMLSARARYSELGGYEAAGKEVAADTGRKIYENRETIAQAAYDNREAVAKVLYDNRQYVADAATQATYRNPTHKDQVDPIADVAYQNREVIAKGIFDHREELLQGAKVGVQAANNNKGVVIENLPSNFYQKQ